MDDVIEPAFEPRRWERPAPPGTRRPAQRSRRQARQSGVLSRTVENDIVPRLLLAHRVTPAAAALPMDALHPEPDDVVELTRRILADDIAGAHAFAERIFDSGVSAEMISLELLAPSAARLGEMWCDDRCDFVAVSLGTWHLQQMLHEFAPRFRQVAVPLPPDHRALLLTVPGEQHTFPMAIVGAFFRAAGWSVNGAPQHSSGDVVSLVRRTAFGVIGLSLASSSHIPELSALIRLVRRESRNPTIGVMVGGWMFRERPDLVRLVGADICSADARTAPLQAETLMSLLVSPE